MLHITPNIVKDRARTVEVISPLRLESGGIDGGKIHLLIVGIKIAAKTALSRSMFRVVLLWCHDLKARFGNSAFYVSKFSLYKRDSW